MCDTRVLIAGGITLNLGPGSEAGANGAGGSRFDV
jgi:hypothetical protein